MLRVVLIVLGALVGAGIVGAVVRGGGSARPPEPPRQPDSGQVTQQASLSALDLRRGDCYNTRQALPTSGELQEVATVDVVPCTSPHTDQIVAKITYKPTDQFDAVVAKKGGDCRQEFAKLDRSVRNDPSYQTGYLMPMDAVSWARNKSVACFVSSTAPTTTSVVK